MADNYAVGYAIGLENPELDLNLFGSPYEVDCRLQEDGYKPQEVANHRETCISRHAIALEAPVLELRGGLGAHRGLDILELVSSGQLLRAAGALSRASLDQATAQSFLQYAVTQTSVDLVEGLLKIGAAASQPGELGLTPLHWASAASQREIVSLLVAEGADPNALSWFLLKPAELLDLNRVVDGTELELVDSRLWDEVLNRLGW